MNEIVQKISFNTELRNSFISIIFRKHDCENSRIGIDLLAITF